MSERSFQRADSAGLFEITRRCRASYALATSKPWLRPGEWTLWDYGPGGVEKEEFFGSREEAALVLAARGLGIGGVRRRFANSTEWDVVEVS